MKNSFDNNLKQIIEQASTEDAGMSFNRDKLWAKVEAKQRKTIVFKPWVTHAAAVAAGLVIGIYFWSSNNELKVPPQNSIVEQKIATSPVQQLEEKITETKVASQSVKQAKTTKQIVQQDELETLRPAVGNKPYEEEVYLPKPGVANPLEPLIASAPALPRKQKVLHLADMNNENGSKQIVQNLHGKSFLVKLLDRQDQIEQSPETVSVIVAGYFKKHNN